MEISISEFWVLTIGAYLVPVITIWWAYRVGKKEGSKREKIALSYRDEAVKELTSLKRELKKLEKKELRVNVDEEMMSKIKETVAQSASAATTAHMKRIKKAIREGADDEKQAHPAQWLFDLIG